MIRLIENRLLATLPPDAAAALIPDLEPVRLPAGEMLYQPGKRSASVWFPSTAMISLEYRSRRGDLAELAVVGNDGMIGIPDLLGAMPSHHAIVHSAGSAIRIDADRLKDRIHALPAVRGLCDAYTHVILTHVAQTSACKTLHALPERLCRWLLVCAERQRTTDVAVTQDQIARLLGVRRESINHATAALQSAGCLRVLRGHVQILDTGRLEALACECLGVIRGAYRSMASDSIERRRYSAG